MTTKQIDEIAWTNHPFTWKNNRGAGILKNGNRERYITFGFPPPPPRGMDKLKGGDRIGWTEIEVTPDMVGKKIAVFTNIEIKGPGDILTTGQKDWHNKVIEHYGISKIWYENKVIKEIIK